MGEDSGGGSGVLGEGTGDVLIVDKFFEEQGEVGVVVFVRCFKGGELLSVERIFGLFVFCLSSFYS